MLHMKEKTSKLVRFVEKKNNMEKKIVNDILWTLNYVHNSVKIYGQDHNNDWSTHLMHLKKAVASLEEEQENYLARKNENVPN